MKGTGALQIIFAFFLGLVVVAFVGIGVNTFYPEPAWRDPGTAHNQWQLVTGIILLIIATALLAISLALPDDQVVISNGVLLGGVGTMLYAVGITVSANNNIWRFVVVAVALAVTVAIGYLKFARRSPLAKPAQPAEEPAAAGQVDARLAAVERKLDALGRALLD
ncbi:MAG: hypothetical protein AAGC63_14325 [Propionicimonas sp.]